MSIDETGEVARLRKFATDRDQEAGMYEHQRDEARAALAALRGRLEHIVDRYGDAHDAKGCAVLHDLRALLDGAR